MDLFSNIARRFLTPPLPVLADMAVEADAVSNVGFGNHDCCRGAGTGMGTAMDDQIKYTARPDWGVVQKERMVFARSRLGGSGVATAADQGGQSRDAFRIVWLLGGLAGTH